MDVFLTGGTGFIGGHVARALRERGHGVVALARASSDTSQLRELGATIARGDVTDVESLASAMTDADAVVHCAAVVGAYGAWEPFEKVGVQGTANVIEAAKRTQTRRFIHVSSIAVYGMNPDGRIYSEATPLEERPERWNHYVREKVLSERHLWQAHERGDIVATSLRPSTVIGAGDRNFLPRAKSAVTFRFGAIIGSGDNEMPLVVIDDLADAVVRALEREEAAGKAYNISGREAITQRDVLDIVSDALGVSLPTRTMPFALAMRSAALLELTWRLARRKHEPPVTRFAVAISGQHYRVDCTRAAAELDWRGDADYAEAIRASVAWEQARQR